MTRRSLLRGVSGALLTIPWLESLAGTKSAVAIPAQRQAFFYVPIGVVRRAFFPGEANAETPIGNLPPIIDISYVKTKLGYQPIEWTPTLSPLKTIQDKVTLITGMDRAFQSGTDVHAQCASCYLSSAAPNTNAVTTSVWPLDRTLDQVVGDRVGKETPFRTMEFSCNSHKDNLESIYFDNISWYGTGHVAPSIRDPRQVYQRMFGTQHAEKFKDITSLVLADANDMKRKLGSEDAQKFSEYFDSIRGVELQMVKLESMQAELDQVKIDEPTAAYMPRGEYIRLMGDLMIVALQTGLTHVATMMIGPERWNTPFTYEGIDDAPLSYHKMSHSQPDNIETLEKIDHFHMQQFAYLLERMDSIAEGNGTTLLDNTLFTYGSGLGDGSTHQYNDLPVIVAGRGGGKIRSGQHLHCADGTPLANLWLTQAQVMGVDIKEFSDSTGHLGDLVV